MKVACPCAGAATDTPDLHGKLGRPIKEEGLKNCPYNDCPFQGTQAEVDDHVAYMTSVVQDKEHGEKNLRESR